MLNILIVGIGGFIGSALRYLVSGWAQQLSNSLDFPYGTLAVNLIGCFAIGFLDELAEARIHRSKHPGRDGDHGKGDHPYLPGKWEA